MAIRISAAHGDDHIYVIAVHPHSDEAAKVSPINAAIAATPWS